MGVLTELIIGSAAVIIFALVIVLRFVRTPTTYDCVVLHIGNAKFYVDSNSVEFCKEHARLIA
jgi:hypothetical protein